MDVFLVFFDFLALLSSDPVLDRISDYYTVYNDVCCFGLLVFVPKIVIFFLTFLPQFVVASDPQAAAKLLFLGLLFTALGLPVCALMIVTAEQFTGAIRRTPRIVRILDWMFAGVMGAFAVRLVLARPN